jgi:LytS/YehU family sensor histidine kinase
VSLEKELANMQDYIELQKMRTGELATISYKVSGDPSGKKVAPLLFLPLIENSFKHGIKGETGTSFIDMNIYIDEKGVQFDIRNNKGFSDPVGKKEKSGIGLENLRRRLDLLYPDQYSLISREDQDVFYVKLTVPLQHEAEVPDR